MIIYSTTALFKGLSLCLKNREIRRLAILPWLIGALCYIFSLVAAYYSHAAILNTIVAEPDSFFGYLLYAAAWLLVSFALLISTLVISITLTLILSGPFHSAIAEHILSSETQYTPVGNSFGELFKETTRTIFSEIAKLLWLAPIFIIAIALGIIPILTPFALLLGAWLLAFQFIDIPLDLLKYPARKRIGFCISNLSSCVVFGLTMSLLWAIPFLGIVLAPAATVGATLIVLKLEGKQSQPTAVRDLPNKIK